MSAQIEPTSPSAGLMNPIMAGYFLAVLEKHGHVTVEDWNKAVALGEKHKPDRLPAFPKPPTHRG